VNNEGLWPPLLKSSDINLLSSSLVALLPIFFSTPCCLMSLEEYLLESGSFDPLMLSVDFGSSGGLFVVFDAPEASSVLFNVSAELVEDFPSSSV
jgi:hypothetical protein